MIKGSSSCSYEGSGETEFTNYHHHIILAEIDPHKPKDRSLAELLGGYVGGLANIIVGNIILSQTLKDILLSKGLTTKEEFDKLYEKIDEEKGEKITKAILDILHETKEDVDDDEQ